ncbi:MAG TPA: SDR family NAD(P)-dependent oxidoreductase [Gemmatimonadales bacterium]|nr:SDR family NAD(P)-dependent oxidoreductase [Gemmatimonadales bacterium]
MIDLSGKRAFVTGGTRGIGRATALLLAAAGARVALGYRQRAADAEQVAAAIRARGRDVRLVAGDLGEPQAAARAVALAAEAGPDGSPDGLDILIVNHGVWVATDAPVARLTDTQWEGTRRANLDAVLYVCRAAIPRLADGGRIVLVSSTAGQRGEAFHADYAATKGAVIAFTKSLAIELAPRHITVNCVAPGWVDTEMAAEPYQRDEGRGRQEIERSIPLGRVATAEDIAGPIVFLCSDWARHITGEILNVNGGSVLCG